jgi:hypothetical protein
MVLATKDEWIATAPVGGELLFPDQYIRWRAKTAPDVELAKRIRRRRPRSEL